MTIPLLITLLYRLLTANNPLLSGISPLFALFFLTDKKNLGGVLTANLLMDAFLSLSYGLTPYSFIPSVIGLGYYFLSEYGVKSLGFILGGTLFHYFFTNTISWLTDPVYLKTFAGWVQCNTIGNPLYAPSYLFFIKAALGNAFFYALFKLIGDSSNERARKTVRT